MEFFQTILIEMFLGNFSFAILIVGIIQIILMAINLHYTKKNAAGQSSGYSTVSQAVLGQFDSDARKRHIYIASTWRVLGNANIQN